MFVIGNLIGVVAQAVNTLLSVYTLLIVVRVLISWVSADPFNPLVVFLVRATDPVLGPCRRIIPTIGPIDISPIVAIFIVQLTQKFLVATLFDLSQRLR